MLHSKIDNEGVLLYYIEIRHCIEMPLLRFILYQ